MAEQSVGMTSGAGDGTVGGYTNLRMVSKDSDSIGNGILLKGAGLNNVATSGTSLIFSAGSVMNNGFLYQNTSSLTINTSTIPTGTYYAVCRVNDTGLAETVTRSATGTTIPLRSVRICVIPTASLDGGRDILLSTLNITVGNIDSFTPTGTGSSSTAGFAQSVTITKTEKVRMYPGPTVSTPANIATSISLSGTASDYGILVFSGGTLLIRAPGTYQLSGYVQWIAGSSGTRTISIASANYEQSIPVSSITNPSSGAVYQNFSTLIDSTGNTTVSLSVTSTVATSVIGCLFHAVRV